MSVADQCGLRVHSSCPPPFQRAVSLHRQVRPAADVDENDVLAGDLMVASLHQHVRPAIQAAEGLQAEGARPGDQPVIDALPLVP